MIQPRKCHASSTPFIHSSMHSFIHPTNQFAEHLLPAQRFAGGWRCCHDLGDAPAFMGIRVYRGCVPLIGQRLASVRRRQREATRGISLGRTELCRPLTDSPPKALSTQGLLQKGRPVPHSGQSSGRGGRRLKGSLGGAGADKDSSGQRRHRGHPSGP